MFRSPEREAFLRTALRSLRPGRARAALERELRGHMDDAAEAYRAQGLTPEEAEARAVASMGDPRALARQIRQAHRPAAPVGALALLAALGAASAVLQTASQGPGALASPLLALALGGALAAVLLYANGSARAQELLYVKNSGRALLEGDLSAGAKLARSGDYLLVRLTGPWGWWAWPALLALPLALGLRLCRTARRAPDPEGAAVAAACAAALLARTAAYALANLGWTATEPNLPVLRGRPRGGLRGARGRRAAAPLAPGGKRWYALSLRGVAPRGEERARMRRENELRILPVGPENRAACLGLRTAPGQEGFVESVEDCLREAQGYGAWRPVALLRGEEVVGFAMYGFFPMYKPAGRVWLDRLLIGAAHQGRGYGRAALGLLLARLRAEYGNRDVYLSVVAGNEAAARLYASFGFVRTGEKDIGGEEVYVRRAEEMLPPS